ncbi:hypothetical protein GGD81_001353 [Rhodobium orientis]|uniref:Uncharacterized protein n=1 Tax=Rhodobium orientis TaxID=34017 RepID=A0A327JVR9_9HYPH|nr:hypothetical protein [Rhodobium orientis]MBB4302326.1 hypothetical protein [Rhodobium orientis]MBK5949032.1 hypothetical protein [Rhodobium orientis]RAI29022.1 hypothetical protein CH339_04895 [Rhodobium orientis]
MVGFIHRSQPPEPEGDPPPAPSKRERLERERAALLAKVRRGVCTERQVRILRRINAITETLLKLEATP